VAKKGALAGEANPAWFDQVGAEEWATRYEAVRRQAIQERHSLDNGWELALLVRRGVVAWMRAWPAVTEPRTLCHHCNSDTDVSQAAQITIPSSVSEQITSVLVSMILPQRSASLKSVP
jgi:hypothetical protein